MNFHRDVIYFRWSLFSSDSLLIIISTDLLKWGVSEILRVDLCRRTPLRPVPMLPGGGVKTRPQHLFLLFVVNILCMPVLQELVMRTTNQQNPVANTRVVFAAEPHGVCSYPILYSPGNCEWDTCESGSVCVISMFACMPNIVLIVHSPYIHTRSCGGWSLRGQVMRCSGCSMNSCVMVTTTGTAVRVPLRAW